MYLAGAAVIVLPVLVVANVPDDAPGELAALRSAADVQDLSDDDKPRRQVPLAPRPAPSRGAGDVPALNTPAPTKASAPTADSPRRTRQPTRVDPYLYLRTSSLPNVREVMSRTGVAGFTLAFVLSDGGCRAVWDGGQPVAANAAALISAIRAGGGGVMVSFGGWAGAKLGERCPNPQALADAYQRIIDVYRLRAIDVDIEHHEFENAAAQDRVLAALKIIEARNPGITTSVTIPVVRTGLNSWGQRLVRRAAELRVPVDVWTIMPFVLGRPGGNMGRLTIAASEHTYRQLRSHYPGASDAEMYRKIGISTMNGETGAGETITQADFREIRAYVHRNGLGRFTFWAVNRDMPCPSRGSRPCSGVPQRPWQFTDIVNGVPGGP